MRLRVLSDLHLEFGPFDPPQVEADVVLIPGDIDLGAKGVEWAARAFPNVPVLILAGNHEFYFRTLQPTIAELCEAAAKTENVRFLEKDELVIDGVRFLGTTLWTDFELFDRVAQKQAKQYAARAMRDFQVVGFDGEGGRWRLTVDDSIALHKRSRSWLAEKIREPFEGKTVVLTHHLPHKQSIAERFEGSLINAAFASNLEHLMGPPVALWVHGHTHISFDYEVRGTRILCNPRDYDPRELNDAFITCAVKPRLFGAGI